ncbi:MAG: hypothetical protein DVB22_003052 [Verrucomicrobia bacterium]|jgi:hypothetical protein|nr:MAG: hypothetical protein DVB22_003052 [Verrucomicrobiota bacterium]
MTICLRTPCGVLGLVGKLMVNRDFHNSFPWWVCAAYLDSPQIFAEHDG